MLKMNKDELENDIYEYASIVVSVDGKIREIKKRIIIVLLILFFPLYFFFLKKLIYFYPFFFKAF